MKKLLSLILVLLLLPAGFAENGLNTPGGEDTLTGWIPYRAEEGLFLRYDTYRDYYVLADASGKRLRDNVFFGTEDWNHENILIVNYGGLFGYYDLESGWLIEPRYDSAMSFDENGLARVAVGELWGVIDMEGNYVFEPQFERIGSFDYDDEITWVRKNGLEGFIRRDGTVLVEPQYDEVNSFEGDTLTWVVRDGLYGVVDREGNEVIGPSYDNVDLYGYEKSGLIRVQDGENWGCVDISGKWVIEPQFEYMYYFDDYGAARVELENGMGLVSKTGKIILEPVYYNVVQESDGRAFFETHGGLWGLVRYDGTVLVEPRFQSVNHFYEGLACVEINGRYGFIDAEGEMVVEAKYEDAESFCEGLAAVERAQDDWVYVDAQGTVAIEPDPGYGMYSYAYGFKNGTAEIEVLDYAERTYRYGLIDKTGSVLLEPVYREIDQHDDGTFTAYDEDRNDTVYGFVNGRLQALSIVSNDMYLRDYYPNTGAKVAKLSGKAHIDWDEGAPYPRLDGAKALLPVYAAFAEAVYPENTRLVPYVEDANALFTYTNTVSAYERLMHGETDMIFCAGPSRAETEQAAGLGVEFELTCMGYEAFVFIVNAENPLESITVDEIRGVYSGEITRWDELGVQDIGDIIAYQRNENSGSQTTLEKLMGDTPLMKAPQMYVSDGMEDILTTIEYRNFPNAISFTFRFFCKDMIGSGVKMLAIDGVDPTEENIRNGSYPLITPIYAVTRKGDTNPNIQIFLDWIKGPQGQELLEKSGYVGIAG
ncbi:MAG: WG repeat-containing protein [Clostridia bacterium]|nr:WG repeat-containing protein [Clostridia bacterium]